MRYNPITRHYFETAPNAGSLSGSGVRRGAAGTPEHGTWVQFDLQVQEGRVTATRFLAFGCPHTIAVCAYLAAGVEGASLPAGLPESLDALMQHFDMPAEKRGRLLVVEDAWRAALAG